MKVFAISSAGFVLLMLMIGLADEAREHNIGPDIVIQLIPYLIPKALMFAMPATCLFSVCVVFGRMAAENELTAIAAMGLSKSVVVMPAIILAFMLSLFAVWLNDISFAWSYWGVQRVVNTSMDKIIYSVLEQEGNFKTNDFSIEVAGVNNRELIQPTLTFNSSNNQGIRAIAASATLEANPDRHSVLFTMHNGFVDAEGKASYRFDDYEQHEIALKSPEQIAKAFDDPGHLYLHQISDAVEKQSEGIDQMTQDDAVVAATQWICGDMVGLTSEVWDDRTEELDDAVYRHHSLHVVPHRRWANGFSCLAFAVIGIPVAMKLKTSNFATTFGICFLPILFIYYPLFMVGLEGAKHMTLPAYGTWLGNIACLFIGGYLLIGELRK